jgi:hypothetical protein
MNQASNYLKQSGFGWALRPFAELPPFAVANGNSLIAKEIDTHVAGQPGAMAIATCNKPANSTREAHFFVTHQIEAVGNFLRYSIH